jgi:signal transduction histidine kinase
MKIRDRFSLQFTGIFAILLLLVLTGIFIITEKNRKADFFKRLYDRAYTIAELFLAEDNLSKEKFQEVQKRYQLYLPNEQINIYNDRFEPVFINQHQSGWSQEIIRTVTSKKNTSFEDGNQQTVGIYYSDNSGNFVVLISANDSSGIERRKQLLVAMTICFLMSVVVMYVLGQFFARAALQPITNVINEVKIIRSANLDKRLEMPKNKDEINELVMTFNNLLEHLEQSFQAQRTFVSNASHELRTPLTSIIGDIEVTLAFERNKEDYKTTLGNVLGTAEKLREMINNLFELAQTTITEDDFEDVRLDELVWQVKDEWTYKIHNSNIELTFKLDADTDKFTIRGKPQLLFIALGNIINNAVKFSENKPILCSIESVHNGTEIRIRDFGIGIPDADLPNIFSPFRRGSNAAKYSGFGIGLSLSEKILKLHNATVTVNNTFKAGTEFVIFFPS